MATATGNIRGMYDGIKKALGPTQSKTAPLKSATGEVITDQGLQMERWVEHFSNLYSRENTVTPSVLGAIKCMPIMEELDVEPTVDELSKVIDRLGYRQGTRQQQYSSRPYQVLQDHPTVPLARSPLPVLERGSCATRHERCQDHYPVQEQGVREVTATTIEASLFSASLAKSTAEAG